MRGEIEVEEPAAALIDNLEDVDDEVYTVDSGRSVRRRRSDGTGRGTDPRMHGIVALGQLNAKAVEVQELFDNAMYKMIIEASASKKLQLKLIEKEMDLRMEKLVRNLNQMANEEAIDQETEAYMKSVEDDHKDDLPSGYMR